MKQYRLLLVACSMVALQAAHAQNFKVQKLQLRNGLTVLALEDRSLPSVAYHTVFKVGSKNERPGITGLSHLFEHMMFNGSAKFRPKLFDELIEAGGGSSNAFTTADYTEYFEEFSSNTLDIVLQLEADRMRALRLDKANVEQERGIVKEERRVNTDNSVDGNMYELLSNSAFLAHPYRWDTIGFMKDLDSIRLEDAKEYFRTYYAPNNAVVAVVGDFDTKTLFAKMKTYFESIPAQPAPRPVVNAEPTQRGERRISLHRPAELPQVLLSYKIGSFRHKDDPALDLLSAMLAGGQSSRLYKSLVYEKRLATSVNASNDSRDHPGLFTFGAQAQEGKTTLEIEQALYAALEEVKTNGVTERELQKAKNAMRFRFLGQFKTNLGRAQAIAQNEARFGSWKRLMETLPKYDSVSLAEIKAVANRYFSDRTRTVITLIPDKQEVAGEK